MPSSPIESFKMMCDIGTFSREGGGDLTLVRRVCANGVLNLPPCSGVEKPKKYTLSWSYHSFLKTNVLCCIVLYCIVLYCIVLYCIVLYYIALHCIALHCICIVLYCIVLKTNYGSEKVIHLYITGCREKIHSESAVVAKRRRLIRAIYFLTTASDIKRYHCLMLAEKSNEL